MRSVDSFVRLTAILCALTVGTACYAQNVSMSGNAAFKIPCGVTIDDLGNIYVTDGYAVRKVTRDGKVTAFAGDVDASGHMDGKGATARFSGPCGIAADGNGNIYVADSGPYANMYIRKITPQGLVSTLAGKAGRQKSRDGTRDSASFAFLGGIAVDRAGTIYVTDRGAVRKITPSGTVTTLAGDPDQVGFKDGKGPDARFGTLVMMGIATDNDGNVYVADMANEAIRKITPDGTVTTLVRNARKYQEGEEADTSYQGLVVDGAGNIFVSDGREQAIIKISSSGAKKVFAGASRPGYVDGEASVAAFDNPAALAIDGSGNIYVVDNFNQVIRKITPTGVVTTIAGTPGPEGYHD